MNVRLVAYRIPTTSDTVEDAYNLDLEKAPNVSLNFRFSDIKNPETRKASYSQTFKLPFTTANNEFFQNWFNVNLDTLVFSTKTKFNATLFVGTVPQFDGFIQLKAVYQKAKRYEVVLMSNTSDLFTAIGEKKLRDVYLNDDGSYSDEMNHLFNYSNIIDSWDGESTDFENMDGVSLQDPDALVQKIMYPLTATRPNFYFQEDSGRYLDMSNADMADYTQEETWELVANIDQLRPAIQLKELITKIMARAGFSYTSSFIDGSYFGNLYMTIGNSLGTSILPVPSPTLPVEGGILEATKENVFAQQQPTGWSQNGSFGTGIQYDFASNGLVNCSNAATVNPPPQTVLFFADNEISDIGGVWENGSVLTRISYSMQYANLRGEAEVGNAQSMCSSYIDIDVESFNPDTGVSYSGTAQITVNVFGGPNNNWTASVPLAGVPLGAKVSFRFRAPAMKQIQVLGVSPVVSLFATEFVFGSVTGPGALLAYSHLTVLWIPYNPSQYGNEILIPACIDEEITQRAFLRDIIQRFNLVIVSDPDDPTNILIEPYKDFFGLGTIKDWTEKLDVSKEVIVKDTTSLQKKIINMTDLEDVDVMNKTIKEYAPSANVFGKYYSENYGGGNDFATGELKNESIFSPYINQKVLRSGADQEETELGNVVVQYEISYKMSELGVEPVLEETKPKLFYYGGKTTDIRGFDTNTKLIYLHRISPTSGEVTGYPFDKYPVCTAYDITADPTADTYTLSSDNKSLYWGNGEPMCGEINVFNYTAISSVNLEKNSLFFLYWKNYLDSIYSTEARIMEAYFNLNEVDILNFKFNDEIFIKDTWWRIQTIENYQVGVKASTKVVLMKKVDDAVALPQDCDYVNSGNYSYLLTWCPSSNVGCTPVTGSPYTGFYAPISCCEAAGGYSLTIATAYASEGLYPCLANASSLPMALRSLESPLSLFNQGKFKTIFTGKLGGLNLPFTAGSDRGKYGKPMIPQFGDDMVIKYKNKYASSPSVVGENHRMILLGNTSGTTRGYAYPENNRLADKLILPDNANVMVAVKGVTTIVGGTNSTYVVGTTESFSYNTVFVVSGGGASQIGAAGGVAEWSIKDPTLSTTSTIYIATSTTDGSLEFALDDSQADTEKSWTLTVDLTVQQLSNLNSPYGTDWAIWQEGLNIEFMDYNYLIWN